MKIDKKEDNNSKDEIEELEGKSYIFMSLWVDLLTYILISIVVVGSYKIYYTIDERIAHLKLTNPNYKFPSYSELTPTINYLLIMIVLHKIFKLLTTESIRKKLSLKYLESESQTHAEIYKSKVSTTIYKGFFYLISTILGYYVMKDLNFFPKTLFGWGEFKNLFKTGYPEFFYFNKPECFDFYYNINLAFALFDGWVLISNPLQSDFLFMILHHLVTYSLIVFSFISNYSTVGAVVYFIHYIGDIFSCIVRTIIHLNVPEKITLVTTLVFLIVFTYTRVFVYGDVIYQVFVTEYEWNMIEYALTTFLGILMMLNLLWIILITRKFIKFCITGNIEEIYKIKVNKRKD